MTPLFLARRRAEHFDSLVEGDSGGRDDIDQPTADLLELVGALRSAPGAQPRAEFVADLRERLMVAASTELKPVPARQRDDVARLTIKPVRTRRERRIGIAVGAFAIVGATTSMAVASQGALPGDPLYPVKRAIENTQAGFAVGDDSKGETVLGNASRRLDEADELTQRGGGSGDAKLVTRTIKDFTTQFTDGANTLLADYETNGNDDSIVHVHHQAQDSIDALGTLDGLIPSSGSGTSDGWSAAHDALVAAAQTVFGIDAQALNLCPDCGSGLTDLPAQLVVGAPVILNGITGGLAGDQLPGTTPPTSAPTTPSAQQHQGGKGVKGNGTPSGLNQPETPITLPSTPSDATGAGGGGGGLGGLLGGHHGTGATGHGNSSNGGKGGKGTPVDLTPVTDTVNQVVTGVVDGVTGLVNGLTGN
jgi:hypothetical protein